MAFGSKMALASLLLTLTPLAAGLGDDTALFQRVYEHHEKICTKKEMAKFQARLDAFAKEQEQLKEKKAKTATEESEANFAKAGALVEPLLSAARESGSLMEEFGKPIGLKFVKYGLQQLLRVNSTPVNLNQTLRESAETFAKNTSLRLKALLSEGMTELEARVEKAIQESFPELKGLLPTTHEPQAYFVGKVLPLLGLEAFPKAAELVKTLAAMPKDPKAQQAHLAKLLPEKCQLQRLITTMTLSGGDSSARLQKFLSACAKELNIDIDLPKPPTRSCVTCQEKYHSSSAEVCNPHCMPMFTACIKGGIKGGLTDECLHSFAPCLRCHKNKLLQLDECESSKEHRDLAKKLNALFNVFQDATVEGKGAARLVEGLANALA